jgi:hypothetical protein
VNTVEYAAARGQLQHSAPSDLAQGRLVNGETLNYRGTVKTCLSTPSARLCMPGARKRPLAHLASLLVLADIVMDVFEVLVNKLRTKKANKSLLLATAGFDRAAWTIRK